MDNVTPVAIDLVEALDKGEEENIGLPELVCAATQRIHVVVAREVKDDFAAHAAGGTC